MQSLSVWYVNNCWFISQILLGSCVHSLDFRYYGLVRKYYTDRLSIEYSISISLILLDINECLNKSHACDVSANCTNNDGSYNCTCKEGYTGDGQSCQGMSDQTQLASYKATLNNIQGLLKISLHGKMKCDLQPQTWQVE